MKKSMVIDFGTIKKDIASETGKAARKLYKNTRVFVKDISAEISKVDWEGMYKDAKKGLRLARRKRNRAFRVAFRKFKRTNFYKGTAKNVPLYFLQFRKWSLKQLSQIQSIAAVAFAESKNWIEESSSDLQAWTSVQYPKVRKFVKTNYPAVEKFVLNQFPAYRLVFAKMI